MLAEKWWQFLWRPELHLSIQGKARFLARSRVSNIHALTFIGQSTLPSDATVSIAFESIDAFAILQSRAHEEWSRLNGSSMRNDLRYTPTSCFQTFPFPSAWQCVPALGTTGQAYYDFRAELMVETDLGLTKTYNRFHDPDEDDPKIVRLRELHAAMDRAVLDAYGWSDIPTDCEFLLDYEIDEEEGGRKKKKPWRYRWPDEVRDEVLARLLELNAQRAAEEARGDRSDTGQGDLFS